MRSRQSFRYGVFEMIIEQFCGNVIYLVWSLMGRFRLKLNIWDGQKMYYIKVMRLDEFFQELGYIVVIIQ